MIKRGSYLAGLFLCMAVVSGFAQKKGQVEVDVDPLVALMQRQRMGTNISAIAEEKPVVDKKNAIRSTAMGFRVQIYSGADRTAAYAEQARFKRLYKDIDTYVTYEEPNYRVKVGDFRSRTEAQGLMQGLRKQFNNVFIFTEEIYVYH